MSPPEPPDAYPPALEAEWLRHAEAATGRSGDDALEVLRADVQRLSDLFTTARPDGTFPDYFADPRLLAAYGLFFLPQAWARTGWALAHAIDLRGWRPSRPNARILDLGSGAGGCGLRAARKLTELGIGTVELVAVDRSATALAALESVAGSACTKATVNTRLGEARETETWPEGDYDLIVAGFVLNELGLREDGEREGWMKRLSARLAPGGLLVLIEPALRATAEPLRRLSDARARKSPRRIGPEVDALPCPLLGGEHWDHEVREWTPPPVTEYLNRKLHRDLGAIRFSQALFSDAALTPLPSDAARVVAEPQLLKGLYRIVVSQGGRLRTVEVPTRGLAKREAKLLAAGFARGDIVALPDSADARQRLGSASELRRLGP
ncbi:MAG: methyltransferase [Opitutales bacterium]